MPAPRTRKRIAQRRQQAHLQSTDLVIRVRRRWTMEANQTRTGVIASVFPVPSEKPTASNMLRQQAWQVHGRCGGVSVASDYQSHVRPPRAVVVDDCRGHQAGVSTVRQDLVVAAVLIDADADVPAARVPRVLVGVELHGNEPRVTGHRTRVNLPRSCPLVLVKETQTVAVRVA